MAAVPELKIQRPARTFDIDVNGENTTITMSYGLFNEIMKVVPKPENIGDLLIQDPFLRDYIVRRMLTGNKKVTSDEDLVDAFDCDVDIERLDELVAWVGDHILHFFITSARKTAVLGEKYTETITQLTQSQSGAET